MEIFRKLKNKVIGYFDTKINMLKFKAINSGGTILSSAIMAFLLLIFGFFLLMFLSLSAAHAISSATGLPFLGYLIVGAFYLICGILVVVLKNKIITNPLVHAMLKKFYFKINSK